MVTKKTTVLAIGLAAIVALGVLATIIPTQSAFADTICKGEFACAAIGGAGGDGGKWCFAAFQKYASPLYGKT